MKKAFVVMMLLAVTGSAWATTDWWDGTGPAPTQTSRDRDWFNSANWVDSGNVIIPGVPTAATEVRTHRSNAAPYDFSAVISADSPFYAVGGAVASVINIGGVAATNNGGVPYGQLTIDSGVLTVGNGLRVGGSSSSKRSGEFFVNGGTVNATAYLAVGYGPSAGGNSGWMYMTDGVVNAGQFDIGRVAGAAGSGINGYLYMTGGTINANEFRMKPAGGDGIVLLDISGDAQIIIVGNVKAAIEGYIDNGWIKSLGEDISYDDVTFDGTNTIIAVPEPATICLVGLGALSLIRRK